MLTAMKLGLATTVAALSIAAVTSAGAAVNPTSAGETVRQAVARVQSRTPDAQPTQCWITADDNDHGTFGYWGSCSSPNASAAPAPASPTFEMQAQARHKCEEDLGYGRTGLLSGSNVPAERYASMACAFASATYVAYWHNSDEPITAGYVRSWGVKRSCRLRARNDANESISDIVALIDTPPLPTINSVGTRIRAIFMAEARIERRLVAILAADVAGYSRLMSADETGTLS